MHVLHIACRLRKQQALALQSHTCACNVLLAILYLHFLRIFELYIPLQNSKKIGNRTAFQSDFKLLELCEV